ncbi:MAG: hypothetical protein B7Z63_06535, partial [Ignavibacteriae bacterium 37-53-5]
VPPESTGLLFLQLPSNRLKVTITKRAEYLDLILPPFWKIKMRLTAPLNLARRTTGDSDFVKV